VRTTRPTRLKQSLVQCASAIRGLRSWSTEKSRNRDLVTRDRIDRLARSLGPQDGSSANRRFRPKYHKRQYAASYDENFA
jgi:hypothetical protein